MLQFTRNQARTLQLATMGLLHPPEHAATKADVLDCIRRMAVLQIDTIHVVARSPYLVLWSRLGEYQQNWLDELLAEGSLFEYWSHEACFLPIEEYPLYRRLMLSERSRNWRFIREWLAEHQAESDAMRDYIRNNGPVRSSDFTRSDGQASGWWNWKAEKMSLEVLFAQGDLMIARRERFQRIYDLRERILPDWDDAQAPVLEEVWRAFALIAVRAMGFAPATWVSDYFRTSKRETMPLLPQLAAEGLLLTASLEGWDEPIYIHPDNRQLAEQAAAGELTATTTTLLSPFDPLVWDRSRALALFDFDYRIECYTPAPKRRYGYFTLPILHRGALIGRLDPKAHRKEGIFEIKALHLEPGVVITDELVADLGAALQRCATWHGTPQVVVRQSDPAKLAKRVERAAKPKTSKRIRLP